MGGLVSGVTDALGLTDSDAGAGEMARSRQLMQDILTKMEGIDLPDYEKIRLAYEALQSPEIVGELFAEELGPSALEEIQLDPELREAQYGALEQIRELGKTGLAPEDLAAARELSRQVGAQEQARQESILSGMAQRGALDSGIQLAAQLSSSQNAANQQATQADRLAMQAGQARRDAIARGADLAGSIEQRDFSRQQTVKSAADRIADFNAKQRMNVQQQNLGQKQKYADAATQLQNQKTMVPADLERQKFQDRITKTGGVTGAMSNIANQQAQIAGAKASASSAPLQGIAQLGMAAAPFLMPKPSDKRVKENIKPAKSDEIINKLEDMLSELKGYKYDYKSPEYGGDDNLGVMAQDLEKSDLGSEFVEEDMNGTKMVDYGKMASTQLVGLADLYDRVKNLERKS